MRFDITSDDAMREFGERLAGAVKPGDVIELIGDVGAGKTTLVKGLARGLGATEEVSSPSFTLSRVYDIDGGAKLYHYDFYRLSDAGILRDELREVTGDGAAITVIEWAEIVDDVLPADHIRISIRATGELTRELTIYGMEGLQT